MTATVSVNLLLHLQCLRVTKVELFELSISEYYYFPPGHIELDPDICDWCFEWTHGLGNLDGWSFCDELGGCETISMEGIKLIQ